MPHPLFFSSTRRSSWRRLARTCSGWRRTAIRCTGERVSEHDPQYIYLSMYHLSIYYLCIYLSMYPLPIVMLQGARRTVRAGAAAEEARRGVRPVVSAVPPPSGHTLLQPAQQNTPAAGRRLEDPVDPLQSVLSQLRTEVSPPHCTSSVAHSFSADRINQSIHQSITGRV